MEVRVFHPWERELLLGCMSSCCPHAVTLSTGDHIRVALPKQVLDADEKRLTSSQGVLAQRDIVQFVKFSDHRNDGYDLAKELLAELPGQFLDWTRCATFCAWCFLMF